MPVLYLKYRPQSLDDLIGQPAVSQTLLNSFKNQKLSHAYLFVGPRGTGKTSTARILAKMVNCGEDQPPCNQCASCLSITDGSNMDIIEIDAASNRGIDDIRMLRENVKLSPTGSKKKIYIIDEVHMLTTEAFNALLKTLEEPPAHVIFILATTDASKIPQTILSRVQKLEFNLALISDLVLALKKISESEKLKVEEEAFGIIAKAAQGSFRDAVKLLDQIASTHPEVTTKVVLESLKTSDFESLINLLSAISEKNTGSGLSQIVKLTESGNTKELILSLMGIMRDLVFIKNNLTELVKDSYPEEKFKALESLAGKFNLQDLTASLGHFQQALENLKTASIVSLPLEIAVVEICQVESRIMIHESSKAEIVIPAQAGIQIAEKINVRNKQSLRSGDLEKLDEEVGDSELDQTSNFQPQDLSSNIQHPTSSPDIAKLHEKWTFVLETIRPFNYSLEALLRTVKIIKANDGLVIMEVPYSFHQRILESPKSKDLMESVLAGVLEKPVKISTVLGTRPTRIEDIANVEMAADDEIINLASEIFNGKLID